MLWKNYGKAMEFFSGDLYEPCKNDIQACKWQVKKLPEKFSAQKLRHIVSPVCYKQNTY